MGLENLRLVSSYGEEISGVGQRAKALPLGASHGSNDVASTQRAPLKDASRTAPVRLCSSVRAVGRVRGTDLIARAVAAVSRPDLAAVVDMKRNHLDETLPTLAELLARETREEAESEDVEPPPRPWPAEAFVLIAERRPDLAVEIVLAYVSLLSTSWVRALYERIGQVLEERQKSGAK